MNDLLLALAYGAVAGLAIPLGGFLAQVERIRPRWLELEIRHSVMAFGGGILVAAVALVLVPEGIAQVPGPLAVAAFCLGGVLFGLIERLQLRHGGSQAQFLAMLADFLPESLALGALIATGSPHAGMLAFLIGAQNLPEAFNAWREINATGQIKARHAMGLFLALAALGPLAVILGELTLAERPVLTGTIMLLAGGGILFLMFQAIAVKAHLKDRQAPSLAAVAGFAVGLIGQILTA
jgi:ZIP family zinc transporter